MGGAYPELAEHAESIEMWLAAEEEGFGRTLAQGMSTLREHIERAREEGVGDVSAEDVFRLHDTFGFPYEMTSELLAEEGLAIEGDFELADGASSASAAGPAGAPGATARGAAMPVRAASAFAVAERLADPLHRL